LFEVEEIKKGKELVWLDLRRPSAQRSDRDCSNKNKTKETKRQFITAVAGTRSENGADTEVGGILADRLR